MRNVLIRFLLLFFASSVSLSCAHNVLAQATSLTVNTDQRRTIGGVSTLDRAKYFNHTDTLAPPSSSNLGNLRQEVYSQSGLNLTPGRGSSEFDQTIGQLLGEDAARPGFMDPSQLRNKLRTDFRDFTTNSGRWESFRNSTTDPIYVLSGRSAEFFPDYFRQGEQSNLFPNRDSYSEFLNIFLEEAVYGPAAFLPVNPDRLHIEVINEPDLHIPGIFSGTSPAATATLLASSQELARYHRDIAQSVKAVHPSASIGAPSLAVTNFSDGDYHRWNNTMKPMIDIAGEDVDFYSIHPYERYDVQSDGSVIRAVQQSPGRINSQLDMIVNQQEQSHGNRLQVSLSEYSSFNTGFGSDSDSSGDFTGYARDLQQWDQSRNFREQLLLYVNRPDVILNAVQFVYAKHFTNDTPTRDSADNVLYEQDANGDWSETIIANTYRMYSQITGDYINVDGSNGDLQTAAFRDGDTVYLMLNNLLDTDQQLDLNVLTGGLGTIDSAALSRVYRDLAANTNVFIEGVDVSNTFGNLILNANEGAVLTFNLRDDSGMIVDLHEDTFYGDQIAIELNEGGQAGLSPEILIDADTAGATKASLRVGYTREGNPESFVLMINGERVVVPGDILGIDDEEFGTIDGGLISREIDVPVEFLVNGENFIQFEFAGGGFLSSTALTVTTNASAIPEPGSGLLLVLAAIAGLARRRRPS